MGHGRAYGYAIAYSYTLHIVYATLLRLYSFSVTVRI